MALIRTSGGSTTAIPDKNQFVDMSGGLVKSYTVGTAASTTSLTGGSACLINVKDHTSITLPNLSSYNGKKMVGIAANGTVSAIADSGGTVDCTGYDYISVLAISGGGISISFTVTA